MVDYTAKGDTFTPGKPRQWSETPTRTAGCNALIPIDLAPTFMNDFPQPGAIPVVVNGQVIGAMGVFGADGEKCAQVAIDAVFNGQATSSVR